MIRSVVRCATVVVAVLLLGVAPLDSQLVLQNYSHALDALKTPKLTIFSYALSQSGPNSIEERHRVYRSGTTVRDETLLVNGNKPKGGTVIIGKRDDRYAVARLAPRATQYQFLFIRIAQDAGHIVYVYETTPYAVAGAGFVVTHVTIDGRTFLPRSVSFRAASLATRGNGEVRFDAFGRYWMPVSATVEATVNGEAARERIAFGDYRFPPSLPPSTFAKR